MRRLLLIAICVVAQPELVLAQGAWPFPWFESKKPAPQPRRRKPPADASSTTPEPAAPGEPGTGASPALPPSSWRWRILHTEWSERDEKDYEAFVRGIGESRCRSTHECLTSSASNPVFRASNPPGMRFYADCADLPYMLRAYFAWKRGLPFSYAAEVTALGASRDIRYTARGNAVAARKDLTGIALDARRELPRMVDAISSAQYRMPPGHQGRLLSDHYPVRISRDSIRPGTIIYDPNGHVVVVYKVTPEGRILYIDTHPDNSLTRGTYGKAFVRSTPGMGAGFKRWRPLRLVGAHRLADGSHAGGHVVLASDKDIADWSDEQFYGTDGKRTPQWQKASFVRDGVRLDYYDFVRKQLAVDNFRYDPLDETRAMVRGLCEDLKYRVEAVDLAVNAGIHKRPQPERLPGNIYGTDGDWETYSTPSRDARLKTSFKELHDEVARFLALADEKSAAIAYTGDNLKRDLAALYRTEAQSCRIAYTRTNGTVQEIGFEEARRRLFDMSFDPYHCAERRWGARDAAELSTCADDAAKTAWYEAEQRLRNQLERTYDARMGFTLGELRRGVPGSGVDAPPEIALEKLLGPEAVSAAPERPVVLLTEPPPTAVRVVLPPFPPLPPLPQGSSHPPASPRATQPALEAAAVPLPPFPPLPPLPEATPADRNAPKDAVPAAAAEPARDPLQPE